MVVVKYIMDGPAISCFNILKILEINNCHQLTNNCIESGISKCKTLGKLVIHGCLRNKERDYLRGKGLPVPCEVDIQDVVRFGY